MRYWSSVTCFSRLLKQESQDLQTDYKGIPGYQQRPRCCETTKLETCAKRLASSWRPIKAHHIFGVLRMNPLFGCWYWDFRSCLLWTPKTGLFREKIITSWFESENSLGWVGWRFCLVVLDFFCCFFFKCQTCLKNFTKCIHKGWLYAKHYERLRLHMFVSSINNDRIRPVVWQNTFIRESEKSKPL